MELISIIIPVYNSEKYIGKLLYSLSNQSYTEIEIIVIDDGSTDDSKKICENYDDERVKVIESVNLGASAARNKGLEIAKGKYVMFMDSDDYIRENMIENYYNAMVKYHVDLVCGNTENTTNKQIMKDILLTGEDCGKRYVVDFYDTAPYNGPWCKMYKKSLIKKGFDTRQLKSNDLVFNLEYLKNVSSICIIPDYSYVGNDKDHVSLTRRYKKNEFEMFVRSNKILLGFLGDLNKYSNHEIRCRLFNSAKSSCMLCLRSNLPIKEKYHEVSLIVRNNELHDSLKLVDSLNFINKIIAVMFKYKLILASFIFFYITIIVKK